MLERIRAFWRNTVKASLDNRKHRKKVVEWTAQMPVFDQLPSVDKHLVVIRTDDIGDFILFQDCLKQLRQSRLYSGWTITLIGNKAWKDLLDHSEPRCTDHQIWLDKKQWSSDLQYRLRFLNQIREARPSRVWIPARTRHFFLEDSIASAFQGLELVTSGDHFCSYPSDTEKKRLQALNYNSLSPKNLQLHEWEFNREVCQLFTGEVHVIPPFPHAKNKTQKAHPTALKGLSFTEYIVLFPGASAGSKRWPPQHFARLIQLIRQKSEVGIVIAGSNSDEPFANRILEPLETSSGKNILNLCGKTSLPELSEILGNAQFVVSNDTSAAHMAACLGTRVFALANGNKYGRFFPYSGHFPHVVSFHPATGIPFNYPGRFPIENIPPEQVAKSCLPFC